jgi:signal transduction histidine kinase
MLNLHRQKLERIGVAEAGDVAEINALLDQAITQTRMMVKGLCPVDIDAEGLIFALQELAAQVESVFSVQCRLVCDESITFSDNVMATQIYYIVQEAINNAIKHARPGRIDIIFNRKIGAITLSIDDNGAGFSRSAGRPGGMGISIMKYRARMINAILDVIRNHTGGTSVICILKK